jgi:F0F1-type ATP synthase assembly protein I
VGIAVDLLAKRELNNGFGESLAKAFELVVTPGIFGFFGWLLDHKLGTTPLFTLLFTLIVFGYVSWRLWGTYERQMQAHEARLGHAHQATKRSDSEGTARDGVE